MVVGSQITTTAAGTAEPAASADFILGRALEIGTAASGGLQEYIRINLNIAGNVVA